MLPHRDTFPQISQSAWVAPGASVIGDVHLGEESSVWYGAVLRGDTEPIRIGARTNVQDGCVLHADPGYPAVVGEGCVLGHNAVVHGCEIEDHCLVGMGCTILNGAKIGEGSIVAAGAVVPEGLGSGSGFHLLWWGFGGRYEVPDLPQRDREGGEVEGTAGVYIG